jgi:hypothetical protein
MTSRVAFVFRRGAFKAGETVPFGVSSGRVLAFRVRARPWPPLEGVESIVVYTILAPARSVPRNVTG